MGKFGIGARVKDDDGDTGVIVGKSKGYRKVEFDPGQGLPNGFRLMIEKCHLTPLANNDNAAPLKVEAGKFYVTRDGRKVGPMMATSAGEVWTDSDGLTAAFSKEDGEQYSADGFWLAGDRNNESDLVAEYVPTFPVGSIVLTNGGNYVRILGEVDEENHVAIVFDNGQEARLPAGDLISAWEPKVGDRVRYADDFTSGTGVIVADAPGNERYFDWTVRSDEEGAKGFYEDDRFDFLTRHVKTSDLSPAPFTLEAGKFYRTRDGRKVGPMEIWEGVPSYPDGGLLYHAPDDAVHGGEYWRGSGVNGDDHVTPNPELDLVAEWVEPEIVVAEATATNWRPAVGDKVRCIDESGASKFRVGDIYTVRNVLSDGLVFVEENEQAMFSYRFESAAPPAKFKVGDRVVVTDTTRGSRARNGSGHGRAAGFETTLKSWVDYGKFWRTDSDYDFYPHEIAHAPEADRIPVGATVTFTATGRLSAINDNGHYQVTFPGLPAGRNSFALPADYVSLAN